MKTIDKEQFDILLPAFVYVIILVVVGFPGNIISIIVYRFQLKSTIGRDAIITLAICDVINCVISIPVELYIMTRYYTFENAAMCKMSRYMTYAMNNAAGLVLLTIAVERYRSICTPHKPKIEKACMRIVIVISVIIGPLLALPSLWIYGIQTDLMYDDGSFVVHKVDGQFERLVSSPYTNDSVNGTVVASYILNQSRDTQGHFTNAKRCLIDDSVRNTWEAYSFFGFLTLASTSVMLCLVVIYSNIAYKIKDLRALASTTSEVSRQRLSAKKKHATFMLSMITLAFVFSFIPFSIITNIRFFTSDGWYNSQSRIGKMIYQFFLRSYYLNCAVNPFIYCVSSPQFRSAVCKLKARLKGQTSSCCKCYEES